MWILKVKTVLTCMYHNNKKTDTESVVKPLFRGPSTTYTTHHHYNIDTEPSEVTPE